jgi:hypothetical protein
MNAELMTVIDSAIASLGDLWRSVPAHERYDFRQDLRQELAIKLFQKSIDVSKLRTAAKNWLLNEFRNRTNRRELEAEYVASEGKRYRTGENWEPAWYPPMEGAEEHAPFACHGARCMHCKKSS